MKKVIKAGLLGLSLIVGASGGILAGPSGTAAAKSYERKVPAQTVKNKIAELVKMKSSLEQQQSNLLDELQTGQDDLINQFIDLLGEPTATNTDTSATQPSDTTATYFTDDQMTSFYFDTLTNIANQDPSIADYFDPAVLDELSSKADQLLTLSDNADNLSASYDKLDQSYNDYVKQAKYSEALSVLIKEINVGKQLNDNYQAIISIQGEISTVISDGLSSQSDSGDNLDEQDDTQNHDEHGD